MKRALSVVVAALAVSAATLSYAGVIGTATVVAPPFNAPDTLLTGFTAYQLSVATDDGSLVSAVDVSINGPLHQRWSDVDFDGNPDPTPNGQPSDGRGDSHLTMIAGALVGSAPMENNNVGPSPLPDAAFDYGLGDFLRGAWGIPGPSQSTGANLAYIVIPNGSSPNFDIHVEVATPNGTFGLFTPDFFIPEPATAILLGSCLIGLVVSRRRGA